MKTILLIATSYFLLNPFYVFSQKLMNGQQIAQKTQDREEGISLKRNLIMELKDKRGKKRIRKTIALRKYFGKEKRLVIFYETPTSVKGTAFLTFDYPEASKEDDQWLYLPALRKTRRISAANRGDYFLGTDLTYEDIKLETKISIEDYKYTTIAIESINGHECYVIEAKPKNTSIAKELGYSKVKFWIDSTLWMMRKSESWDIAGNFLKTVTISNIKKIQNIWTIHHIKVVNHKTKHETIFKFENNDYKAVLREDYFTKEALIDGL